MKKKLGKWMHSERFHKTTSMFLTLCLIFEMMPAQSIAYAREEVASALGVAVEEPAEPMVEPEAEAYVEESAPEPEPEPEVVAEDQGDAAVVEEGSSEGEPVAEQQVDTVQVEEQQPAEAPAEEIKYPAATLESGNVKVEVDGGRASRGHQPSGD